MRYRCLVLDHDDTVVMSTPKIHYPSFVEGLKVLRPDMDQLSLDDFMSYCFNPGFQGLCRDIMKFSDEEQDYQYRVWKDYTESTVSEFYPGFAELITEYKGLGGIICVVSHSESKIITRDYMKNCGQVPDLVFGWELGEGKRKPNPYPLLKIMKTFGLDSHDMLVVDDLKPGFDMARSCRIDFAAAGWSHVVPHIRDYMKENSDYYFHDVESFRQFILHE